MAEGIKNAIEGVMRRKDGGAAGAMLYPLSLVYGLGVRLRLLAYGTGILGTKKLPCKVISVGNITAGGSGKTPVAMLIARYLASRGKKTVILSRGYGRRTRGVQLVSDGKRILLGPIEAGDEPYLMAALLTGVPVVVGEDRFKAGEFAVERFNPDCVVLDDGFQHVRLSRDLNIVLVDSAAGFGNGRLLPRGTLREHPRALKRADAVFVKGDNELGVEESIALRSLSALQIRFSYRPVKLVAVNGGPDLACADLKGKKVAAFAGTADPSAFFKTLEGMGAVMVKTRSFPDHHVYTGLDMEEIYSSSKAAEITVTTEKDGVKLAGIAAKVSSLYALAIEAEVANRAAFEKLLSPFTGGR